MKKQLVNKKVVVSGDIVEVYSYERGYIVGCDSPSGGRTEEKSVEYEKNRGKVLQRARRELRRIVNANIGQYGEGFCSKFVTLTFKENIQDLDVAHNEFKKFIKRLNYKVFKTKCGNIRYSAVIEFQKRGAIHYHVIFYNLPYIKLSELYKIWGNGFVKINKIDNVDNVGAYICKYLTKENIDDRLQGRKSYFNSRGLFKPLEIVEEKQVINIINNLPANKKVFDCDFENEYLKNIHYEQYNLKK